jgi:L,D-transpeptidase YcbB
MIPMTPHLHPSRLCLLLALAGLSLLGLAPLAHAQIAADPLLPGSYPLYTTEASLRSLGSRPHGATVEKFYADRQYRLAWVSRWGKSPLADSLLQLIAEAPLWGLDPADYHQAGLTELMGRISTHRVSRQQVEQADYLLSDAFFSLAQHLERGRFVKNSNRRAQQHYPANPSLIALLEGGLLHKNLREQLASQEPPHEQYRALKKALREALQEQQQEGGAPGQGEAAKIQQQQQQQQRIQQLVINLERWRWEPRQFPREYIVVNIPAYQLQLVEKGIPVLESKIIVGKPATPSPELDGLIECFIIYPYWTVPRSIATKEMLPKIKKDPSYLRRGGFEVLDSRGRRVEAATIDWNSYSAATMPYTFRQREGVDNALGIVKFSFDNPYSVYLHDTNTKKLFQNSMRALSHGCIRVEKALELAHYLIRNDSLYNPPGLLDSYFARQQKKEIHLLAPMPLYIRYFTAWQQGDSLVFYPDLYRKDEKMIRALQQAPLQ